MSEVAKLQAQVEDLTRDLMRSNEERSEMNGDIRAVLRVLFGIFKELDLPQAILTGNFEGGIAAIIPGLMAKFMAPGGIDFSQFDFTALKEIIEKYKHLGEDLLDNLLNRDDDGLQ